MSNIHKQKFEEYCAIEIGKAQQFITEKITVGGTKKKIIRLIPNKPFFLLAKDLAKEKAQHTMSASQAGIERTLSEKEIKQFEGVLAEQMTHMFLLSVLQQNEVLRFDIERPNFQYDRNEYDLKIFDSTRKIEYTMEARNSTSYKTTIEEFYTLYDVIIAYTNDLKTSEKPNSFYIRPVIQYATKQPSMPRHTSIDTLIDNLMRGEVIAYLTCGVGTEIVREKAYLKSMGQGRTQYAAVKMIDALDINEFVKLIRATVQ